MGQEQEGSEPGKAGVQTRGGKVSRGQDPLGSGVRRGQDPLGSGGKGSGYGGVPIHWVREEGVRVRRGHDLQGSGWEAARSVGVRMHRDQGGRCQGTEGSEYGGVGVRMGQGTEV